VTSWFVPVTVVALLLDAVDGRVARRTGTSSAFGSRFDGEVDAFLILVLSVQVSSTFGAWVLTAGLMRYVFGIAGWVVPWMRERLPFRYWRKVVTAAQGVVLTAAAADVLPRRVSSVGLVLGLALLSESFGRDIAWLVRERATTRRPVDATAMPTVVRPEPHTEAV
jgi:phosphatidylglycerophosphate synthase